MKRFIVRIPEKREEVVYVEWEIETDNEKAIHELIADESFYDMAEYLDTTESRYGFEVIERYEDQLEIEEIEDEKVQCNRTSNYSI